MSSVQLGPPQWLESWCFFAGNWSWGSACVLGVCVHHVHTTVGQIEKIGMKKGM